MAKEENQEKQNNTEEMRKEEPQKRKWLKDPDELPKFVRISLIILANTITTLNLASGVTAIVLTIIYFIDPTKYILSIWAARLVLLAIIFDFTDGIPARLAKKNPGFFGTVVDSAADTVSFGFAPMVMIALSMQLTNTTSTAHFVLAICSVLVGVYFGFCTIFRLIRFTKTPSKKWFQGIPSPGAGCAAAVYIIIKLYIENKVFSTSIATPIVGLIFMIMAATMMIVKVRYPTTKLPKNFLEVFLLGLAAIVIVTLAVMPFDYIIYPAGAMAVLTMFYILYGPFYLVSHMLDRGKQVDDYKLPDNKDF
ncbi:MAG: CDP-alcohol phosphatidyltransferase family protein [Candidatus Heimdallarchaeota archaeon]